MEEKDKVYLYGASGHAKVVMDIARLAYYEVPCLIDDNPQVNELAGLPVIHSAEGLNPIIVTIGDCKIRKKIVENLGKREYLTVVHPNAVKAESVCIGYGTVVMACAQLYPFLKFCIACSRFVIISPKKKFSFENDMINAGFCDYQIKYIIQLCRRFVKCGKSI